ncbi:MAG TPA: tetratricopeptide repeat protein [Anaeromyxobacteraceae bacterium]|nr:tetratricopeptide repeat protein [Anaeromyxobacteraceae bacterium]
MAAAVALLLAAVAWMAYRHSLAVPFQLDDVPHIVENPLVHLTRLGWEPLARLLARPRGLALATFALNYRVGGLEPRGYHLVNLAVHAANGLWTFLVARRLLSPRTALDGRERSAGALVAALLFVAHPVQTQAVTYVVQRMASLGAFFGLAAAFCYLEARRRSGRGRALAMGAAGVAWLLAVWCKENYFVLPVVLLGADALVTPGWREALRRHRLALAIGLAALLATGAAAAAAFGDILVPEHRRFGLTLGQRLLTQPRVLFHYLSLLAWPHPGRLRVDYNYPPSTSPLEPPATLPALLGLALAVAAAWRWRRRAPLAAFGAAWFLGTLLPESSVLPIDLVFEHRLYLPSLGVFVPCGAGLAWGGSRLLRRRWAVWAMAAPLTAALAAASDARNRTWNDVLALNLEVAAGGPARARTLLTIGSERHRRGDLAGAEQAFREALRAEPGNPVAERNLGVVAWTRGDRPEAERHLRAAAELSPGSKEAWAQLAAFLLEAGRPPEAERAWRRALEIDPAFAPALVGLASIRFGAGDAPAAAPLVEAALRADPGHPPARRAMVDVLLALQRPGEALAAAEGLARAASAEPGDVLRLAECLKRLGRLEEAERQYRAALERDPRLRGAHFGLAGVRAERGDLAGAEQELGRELELGPHAGALGNMGTLYLRRDPARAREFYRRALELDPSDRTAARGLEMLRRR